MSPPSPWSRVVNRLAGWLTDRLPRWLTWPTRGNLGQRGETTAARHLKRQGYRILARNVRNRSGELDIVAEAPDHRTVVFVEVKAGVAAAIRPEVHVNRAKRRKLILLATQFVRRHRLTDRPLRFDVVGVDFPPGKAEPVIRHHSAAFDAGDG